MRCVAVDTRYFAFQQRHVGTLAKVIELLTVAACARLANPIHSQQSAWRELRHGIVTIAARDIVGLVCRTRPISMLNAIMTLRALSVLPSNRRMRAAGKRYDGACSQVRCMVGSWPMASFAAACLQFIGIITRPVAKDSCVDSVRPVTVLYPMTADASFLSDIGRCENRPIFDRCTHMIGAGLRTAKCHECNGQHEQREPGER